MKRVTSALVLYSVIISQSFAEISEANFLNNQKNYRSSEYIFESLPNQELISVRVLGAVKNAGLYHVPTNINLPTMIALAGGTTSEADTENIIITNEQKNQIQHPIQNINLVESIKENKNQTINENDIIFVKNKTSFISTDTMKSVSVVSLLLSAILTTVIIKEKTARK